MRAIIQRVSQASVTIEGKIHNKINHGFLILLGIENEDSEEDIHWLTRKIINLRVFSDENGAMNRSIIDTSGKFLVVSQFTLHASTKKGNRPSYIRAAKPDFSIPMYEKFLQNMETTLGKKIGTGKFGAMMDVALINDGPVTIIIDSKQKEY